MLLGAFYLILTEKWSKETRGEEKEKRGWGKRRCYYDTRDSFVSFCRD